MLKLGTPAHRIKVKAPVVWRVRAWMAGVFDFKHLQLDKQKNLMQRILVSHNMRQILCRCVVIGIVAMFWFANGRPVIAQGPTPTPIPVVSPSSAPNTLSGTFSILWGDGRPGTGISETIYWLTQDDGTITELDLNEGLAQPLGGVLALNGKRVIVSGSAIRRPTHGATQGLSVQSIQLEPGIKSPATPNPVIGAQPWVSIMCKFADIAAEPKSLTYFQEMYRNSYPGLDHYWREISSNQINLGGSAAFGWYVLPHPESYYVYDSNGDGIVDTFELEKMANDCTSAADAYVYFPNYVGVNLMFNANDMGSYGGGSFLTIDGVTRGYYRTTWISVGGTGIYDVVTMSHEMGHGYGLPHSSGKYGQTYDNVWDVMSDTWANCNLFTDPVYGCVGQGTISYHKDILGWIPSAQKYTVGWNSQATITLEQLNLPQTSNYLIAQIPICSDRRFYTVEMRRQVGYDAKLPGAAVIIHEVDTTRGEKAQVIDIDNNGNTGDAGAMWLPGETFTDSTNGVTVSVISFTETGAVVTLTNSTPADPCEPDLHPYAPPGYPYPVVPSSTFGTHTANTLYAGQPTYFDWHFTNSGTATASGNFYVELWIDTTNYKRYLYSNADINWQDGFDDQIIGVDTPGWHTVKSITDPDNSIAESNETNNTWQMNFYWNTPCYTLTSSVAPSGSGIVNANPLPNCNGGTQHTEGTVITLTASANTGYLFDNWSGNATGISNPTVMTMNSDKSVTANFSTCAALTPDASPNGSGTINVSPSSNCAGGTKYTLGTIVTLTATANNGFVFSNWSGDASGSANPTTVTVSANKNVTANFASCYSLATSASPSGGGNVNKSPSPNCSGETQYVPGTIVTFTATANNGYIFGNWSGDASGNTNPRQITMNSNKNVIALFIQLRNLFLPFLRR